MDVLRYMQESFTAARVVVRSWRTEDSPDKRLKAKDDLDLSEEMNRRPEIGIFRPFGTLSNLSLLYMQAELVQLERDFEIHATDSQSPDEVMRMYAKDMTTSRISDSQNRSKQRDPLLYIQRKLKKYRMTRAMNVVIGSDKYANEDLALQIGFRAYPGPGSCDMKSFRELLNLKYFIPPLEDVWKQGGRAINRTQEFQRSSCAFTSQHKADPTGGIESQQEIGLQNRKTICLRPSETFGILGSCLNLGATTAIAWKSDKHSTSLILGRIP